MDPNRTLWNQQQQALRRALSNPDDHAKALALFLDQHAMVHPVQLTQSQLWSFDDELWQDLTEEAIRWIPPNGEHSIVWSLWHIARIEDVTMNMLIAHSPQILKRDNWLDRMKITVCDTGNAMDAEAIARLSATIEIKALRAYRLAVGRRTRQIVKRLKPDVVRQKVDPACLPQVMAEGAVVEAARGLSNYWGNLTIAGLLLMPPTRHNFVHLNEALRLKQKYQSQYRFSH